MQNLKKKNNHNLTETSFKKNQTQSQVIKLKRQFDGKR